MDHAPQWRPGLVDALGGRDPRHERRRRQEHGFLHAQRQEDVPPRVIGEHLAAQPVNDFAQQDEIDVAIDEAHARRAGGPGGAGETDAGVVAGPFRFERHVGLEAREMREQVAQRDVALASLELGDVVGDLVVQPELALLEELHQRRRGGNDFREGGAVEDGIESHGLRLRNQRPLPVGLAVDDLAVVPDHQNGAGQAVLCDGLVDRFIQRRRAGEGLCGERSGSQRGAPRKLHMTNDSQVAPGPRGTPMPPVVLRSWVFQTCVTDSLFC